jgi:hypothetical protein
MAAKQKSSDSRYYIEIYGEFWYDETIIRLSTVKEEVFSFVPAVQR